MLALPLTVVVALVTQDATPLRAAARETAAKQTLLYRGEWLEVRGERQGWLQVYDHRRERPGYLRPSQVRSYAADESSARDLAAIVDFLRDQPGMEALGIGYAALFLRVAPASAVGAELFDALGTFADRLARRASSQWARPDDATLAAQLEVAKSYGVQFHSFEKDGRARTCYDGEAFRRVLALPASASARARAALALTEPDCVDPSLPSSERESLVQWQADVLDQASPTTAQKASEPAASPYLIDRWRIRRASVQAELAYAFARHADARRAKSATERAMRELALIDKQELADEDALGYHEAAVRVGAVRWAAEDLPSTTRGLRVSFGAGKPGETCVRVMQNQQHIAEHCTYAVVWPSSLRVSPHADAVVIAQSPLPGWTELVLLRRGHDPQALAPAAIDPELGYVEHAGWSPDGTRMLLVREARMTGPLGQPGTLAPWVQKSFQIVRVDALTVEKEASRLDKFVSFRRWQAADWRQSSLALR